jgi:hypothetical protein
MAIDDNKLMILDALSYYMDGEPQPDGSYRPYKKGMTLKKILNRYDLGPADSNMSEDQIAQVRKMVLNDPELANLKIESFRPKQNGNNNMFYLKDPSTGQGVVVLAGTPADGWKPDVTNAYSTDSPQRQDLLTWFNGLDISSGEQVIVSGHSNGGNEAEFLTIAEGAKISRCVALDSEGMGWPTQDFYSQQIAENQSKIFAYNNQADIIHFFLPSIVLPQNTVTIEGGGDLSNMGHPISLLFSKDANGNLLPSFGTVGTSWANVGFPANVVLPYIQAAFADLSAFDSMNPDNLSRADLANIGQNLQDYMNHLEGLSDFLESLVPAIHADAGLLSPDPDYLQDDPSAYGSATRDFTQATEDTLIDYLNNLSDGQGGANTNAYINGLLGRAQFNIQQIQGIFNAVRTDDATFAQAFQGYAQDINDDAKKVAGLSKHFTVAPAVGRGGRGGAGQPGQSGQSGQYSK